MTRAAWGVFLAAAFAGLASCGHASRPPPRASKTEGTSAPARPPPLRYEMHAAVDVKTRAMSASATIDSPAPVNRFFLNRALSVTRLTADGSRAIFHREDDAIVLSAPARHLEMTYAGQFAAPPPGRDYKSVV